MKSNLLIRALASEGERAMGLDVESVFHKEEDL